MSFVAVKTTRRYCSYGNSGLYRLCDIFKRHAVNLLLTGHGEALPIYLLRSVIRDLEECPRGGFVWQAPRGRPYTMYSDQPYLQVLFWFNKELVITGLQKWSYGVI